MTAQSNKTFEGAREDHAFWGRLVESTVGAHLLNSIRGTQIELFYWREEDKEVDFVLRNGENITAIEVRQNPEINFAYPKTVRPEPVEGFERAKAHSGMDRFAR